MPVIFGWGRKTVKQIGVVFKKLCNHCHNEEYWVLTKITTWFSLFFVPIIPYSTKYFLSCPVCKYGLDLNQKQIEEIRPLAETNQLLIDGQITKEEHAARIAQLNGNAPKRVQAEVVEPKALGDNKAELTYCSQCGTEIVKDIRFCGNCGTQVVGTK
jgi:hypothetical protein